MSTPRRPTNTTVRFSPYLLAVALMPAFLNVDYSGCQYFGDSTLLEFELIVDGANYVEGFDPELRSYEATLPAGTQEVRVRTVTSDPQGSVFVNTIVDGERLGFEAISAATSSSQGRGARRARTTPA